VSNFVELINILQRRKESFFSAFRGHQIQLLEKQIIYRANMLVKGYSDISNICRELEAFPGWRKCAVFFGAKKSFFFRPASSPL